MAVRLLPKLKKMFPEIVFVREDPTETGIEMDEDGWILDTAQGISEVTVIEDVAKLSLADGLSVHDYDLALDLKLLKKLGKLNKFRIIAVPFKMDEKEALKKVASIISASLS